MGKYIRKPRATNDVAVKDVSQSMLGVRTRAKTLALRRLQSAADTTPDFLELRSRRLEKPPLLRRSSPSRRATAAKECDGESGQLTEKVCSEAVAAAVEAVEEEGGGDEIGDLEIEASLGENNLDLEARESRGTRESTPSSLIRTADSISTPGSSTRPRRSIIVNQTAENTPRDVPAPDEMDEFFTKIEQPQQRQFIDKYNYDIVNDVPLPPGRYEWIKVSP